MSAEQTAARATKEDPSRAASSSPRAGSLVAVVLDRADDTAVAALFEQIARERGRPDILVTNGAKFAGR